MAKDTCVMCGAETPYDYETNINFRYGYVEGAGQMCKSCYDEGTERKQILVPTDMIYNTPNNQELGEKVRQIYWDSLD